MLQCQWQTMLWISVQGINKISTEPYANAIGAASVHLSIGHVLVLFTINHVCGRYEKFGVQSECPFEQPSDTIRWNKLYIKKDECAIDWIQPAINSHCFLFSSHEIKWISTHESKKKYVNKIHPFHASTDLHASVVKKNQQSTHWHTVWTCGVRNFH